MQTDDISRSGSDPSTTASLIAKPRLVLKAGDSESVSTPAVPSKKGRATTQQLLAVAANSCTPITNYIRDPKRKWDSTDKSPSAELNQPQKLIKTVDSPGSPTNIELTESNDTVIMEKIMEELKDMRKDQAKKHKELTDKLNKKLKDDTVAFEGIQKNLDSLKKDLQVSKTDLDMRLKALEENTVKKDELANLISTPTTSNGSEIINQLNRRIDFLEKETKRTKISITGLSLTSGNHTEEVKIFLESKFEVKIPSISLTEFSRRLIADTFDVSIKSHILKNKRTKLQGSKIFIDPDRTARERHIDWNVRKLIKELREEGKTCSRKGTKVLVDNLVYTWSDQSNRMMSQHKEEQTHFDTSDKPEKPTKN